MEVYQLAELTTELQKFIQSGNYEPYILALMNRSSKVFPGQYASNKDQSHGQSDFYNIDTLEKYEAKLPFDKQEGRLICSNRANFAEWLKYMLDEESEFGEQIIQQRGRCSIGELKLFKTMEKRLKSVKPDENAVFFFPYPITFDMECDGELNLIQMCGDILSAIYAELIRRNVVASRNIFVIYPSVDEKMVLRCLNNNQREYLCTQNTELLFSYKFMKRL